MRESIQKAFPKTTVNNCLQTLTDTEFYVLDSEEGRSQIQTDPIGKKHFTVENPTGRDIHFLAIDKCLFMDNVEGQKRCDFAVFDTKTFCFVEIKESKSVHDAKIQLVETIRLFHEKLTFTTRFVEAHLCVGSMIRPRPARLVSDLKVDAQLAQFNARLYEGNRKRFA